MGQQRSLTFVIADEDKDIRERIKRALDQEDHISCIGEADDGIRAVAETSRLSPDLALISMDLPGQDGLSAAIAIRKANMRSKVVLLTNGIDIEKSVVDAVEAQIMGSIMKSASAKELIETVNAVGRGAPTFHDQVRQQIKKLAKGQKGLHRALTDREFDTLKAIAKGKSNKEIASDFGLTEGTVKGYVSSIFSKLGVADRQAAALYAIRFDIAD